MKKILASIPIVILIILTAFTKSSTKKLDKEIFDAKEELRFLNEKYELVLLDHNFLSSPNKLFEYHEWLKNTAIKTGLISKKTDQFIWDEFIIHSLYFAKLIKNFCFKYRRQTDSGGVPYSFCRIKQSTRI